MAINATAFTKTPQAKDNAYNWTEDALLGSGTLSGNVVTLAVMVNDLGGNAKTLYSVDDGNGNTLVPDFDLLSADVTNGVSAWETTAAGNQIRINNGQIEFRLAGSLSSLGASDVNALAAGDLVHDEFVYAIRMANGTLSQARVTFSLAGANDAPLIAQGPQSGAVKEDQTLSTSGQFTATDSDHNATPTWSVVSANGTSGSSTGAYGSLAVDNTGQWTYTLDNASAAVQALAAVESHDESFTIRVTDDQGAYAEQTVKVTVSGTNDLPVVTNTPTDAAGPVKEDATLTAAGQLAASDVDHGATQTWSVQGTDTGTYGSIGVDGTGKWTYTLANGADVVQSLAEGEAHQENFTVRVTDDQSASADQTVTVTVSGTNDAPVMALADTSGTVTAVPAASSGGGAPTPIVFTVQQYLGVQSNNLTTLRNYAATHQADYTVQTNVIDYTDDPAGFAGELPGSSPWPAAQAQNFSGTGGINNSFFARITANFSVPAADTYTFRTFNDDGVFLQIDNQLIISDSGIHPELPFNGSTALSPGNHSLELFFFEFGGEASLELSARNSTGTFGLLGASGGGLGGAVQVTDSGAIGFSDVDLADAHVVSAAPIGTTVGTLTAVKTSDTTGTGTGGQVDWTYTADNTKLESLAQGETKYDRFDITVDDHHGGVATRQVEVSIVGVNDAPVAKNDAATTNEDTPISIAVLGNDTDVDAFDSKFLTSATGAQHGSLSLNGGNVVYTPAANFNGADSFTYTMKDAAGAASTATVNVTVIPVSDTYTPANLIVNGSFEQPLGAIPGWTVTFGDIDQLSGWQAADGTYSLDLNGFHPGGVQQTLATNPGVQYTIGFALSKNPGNTDHATVQVSAAGSSQSYTFSAANSGTDMKWSQQTLTFTAVGPSTTLEFKSTYPTDNLPFPDNAEGPALDEVVVVTNMVVNNFTKGTGGDVLQLHGLLTSIGAPHDSTAFAGNFLRFAQSGSDTLVQIDANGGGDAYMTVATLVGQSLTQADAPNYML